MNLPTHQFSRFDGDGEVRALLRALDWSTSPLGHPDQWPQELLTLVNLLLNSQIPMFVAWGPQLGFIYNDPYARIMGDKHPAALGGRFQDIWSEIWSDIGPIVDKALAGTPSYFEDLPLTILRSGFLEKAWFTFSYFPVQDGNNAIAGMYCTVVENTSRVKSERRQAFRLRLADRLRDLTEPDDIMTTATGMMGRFFETDRVLYAEIDDLRRQFVIRSEWTRAGYPPLGDTDLPMADFPASLVDGLQAGQAMAVGDVAADPRVLSHAHVFRQIGVHAFVAVPLVKAGRLIAVLALHNGRPRHWTDVDISLSRDMAERTWGAVERARAEAELQEGNRRKDEFLAMLAHELRNPLAPISAAAELLGLVKLDEARLKKTSEVIIRQVRHMTGLVDDLLDVSRVTRGLVTLHNSPQDMKNIVANAVEQVRPLIESRRHHLGLHLPQDAPCVMGDQNRLVQILTNLLNNAAKYTPQGGNLQLSMETLDGHVLLSVIDDGIGIDAVLQPRIFDLFAQAERTSDRSQGGLGLGLALVKSLAELHGGSVACVSEGAGKGSRFTVSLPRLHAGQARDAERTDGSVRTPERALRLLVVDDNVDAARMLALFLEASGHQVLVEHGSRRAIERARIERPDACLLDIGLPDIDGNELARRLRAQPETAGALLIAVTGYGQAHDRAQALAAGFDHHLVKPVDTAALTALLDGNLRRSGDARHRP